MSEALRAGYKLTEVGVIPEDWELSTLGDVAVIKDGTHQTPKYVPSGVPFFSVEHVTSGDFNKTKFISEQEHRFLTRSFKIEKGDILMTRIGSIGDCKLIDWDVDASFYVSLALLKIKPKYSSEFIAHYSKSAAFQSDIELHSLQSAIPRKINLGPISYVRILIPPPPEQRAIAAALSDIDTLLAKLDTLIAKKRNIKQATMQQLLTGQTRLPGFSGEWEIVKAGEIGRFQGGSGFPIRFQGAKEGQYPFFKVSDMNNAGNDIFMKTANNYISESLRKQVGAAVFPAESIVLAKVGAAVFLERKKILSRTSCLDNNMAAFVMNVSRAYCLFIHYVLLSTKLGNLVSTTALPSLSGKVLNAIELLLPSLPEQIAIASVLSDMDTELATLETRRNKTLALKQGMMQELLTGRIRLV